MYRAVCGVVLDSQCVALFMLSRSTLHNEVVSSIDIQQESFGERRCAQHDNKNLIFPVIIYNTVSQAHYMSMKITEEKFYLPAAHFCCSFCLVFNSCVRFSRHNTKVSSFDSMY